MHKYINKLIDLGFVKFYNNIVTFCIWKYICTCVVLNLKARQEKSWLDKQYFLHLFQFEAVAIVTRAGAADSTVAENNYNAIMWG